VEHLIRSVAVAIMAKAPRPGEVKTRLCPPLLAAEAAALYRCFLLDKVAAVGGLADAQAAIAYTPSDARAEFDALAPGFSLVAQQGPDLGARLHGTLAALLAAGHAGAIAVDSDTPTLPRPYLQRAVDALARPGPDVVLGPTEDGGYYLIGVRVARPELFDDVPWSTSAVLEVTLRRAAALGLRVLRLPAWFDVDTPADLERLRAALSAPGAAATARETSRFLASWGTIRRRDAPWRTVSSKRVYANKWISLREDLVALPDGRTTIYGVVTCGECVGLLPFLDADTVLLVRQYRYVAGRSTWEMPTGGVHAGESLEGAAQRELAEETGYQAQTLVRVSTYHTSKSVVDETAHLYLARGLSRVEKAPDDTEFIDVRAFPFGTVLEMVLQGEIVDSMTIIAVLLAARGRRSDDGRSGQ
jgi:rSAM/selenodomain-associated transferase 1